MRYFLNATFPLRLRIEPQQYAIDVTAGENQIGIIVISPDNNALTYWTGDAGVTANNPVGETTAGNVDFDQTLDQAGLWEFRIIRKGSVGDYDLLRRYWVQCIDPATSLFSTIIGEVVTIPFDAVVGPSVTPVVPVATLSGSFTTAGESDIASGSTQLIITLSTGTWVTGASFDAIRQELVDGIVDNENYPLGWRQTIQPEFNISNVVRTSDTVVTITIPATAIYDIPADETLTVTLPEDAFQEVVDGGTVATPGITITYNPPSPGEGYAFYAEAIPEDYVNNVTVSVHTFGPFEIDWGDGVFVNYPAGSNPQSVTRAASNTDSGVVTVRTNSTVTRCQFLTFYWRQVDVYKSDNLNSCESMFANAVFLQSASLTNTAGVTTFRGMFNNCVSLTTPPPTLTTTLVTDFRQMFQDCTSLTTIPAYDLSNGNDFISMFNRCSGLLTLPALATQNGTLFLNMFNQCTNLTSIAAIDTTSTSGASTDMFRQCNNLTSPNGATQALIESASGFDFN